MAGMVREGPHAPISSAIRPFVLTIAMWVAFIITFQKLAMVLACVMG
jgi:hypothetical protein